MLVVVSRNRSRTWVLIFVNWAPIRWYLKRQNPVKASTFASEFIAAKVTVEMIQGLRYKLHIVGIQVDGGPTNMFWDDKSVVYNSTKPKSTLKKKHNVIAYHRVHEPQAAGFMRIAKEEGGANLADVLTKCCLSWPRLRALYSRVLWWRV